MTAPECPICHERALPFEGCLCPLAGEQCPDCGGYLDGGMPECSCPVASELPDYEETGPSPFTPEPEVDHAELAERRREWQARDAAEDDGRDW
jgi:hypothetical protein